MKLREKWCYQLLLSLMALLVAGCTPATEGTIEGAISYDGVPLKDGSLLITNVDGSGRTDGGIISDGRYRAEKIAFGEKMIRVFAAKLVSSTPASEPGGSATELYESIVPDKYGGLNSELRITVDKPLTQHDLNLMP